MVRRSFSSHSLLFFSSTMLMSYTSTVNTRGKLLPNPQHDAIEFLVFCLKSDNEREDVYWNGRNEKTHVGYIVVGDGKKYERLDNRCHVHVVDTERDLIELFLDKLRMEWDPECVAGFEVHHGSWGYLLERAETAFGASLSLLILPPLSAHGP